MGERRKELKVVALIHEENGIFGVSFPDFPGCVTGGETLEEAIRKASGALTFHVAGIVQDGDDLPATRSISEVRRAPDVNDELQRGARLVAVRTSVAR
jgi:predicted RNase H-like HicB family nuclease